MPTSLTASPAGSTSLSAAPILTFAGLFPPFFPGASAYPGRGTTLAAGSVAPKTLIGAPA